MQATSTFPPAPTDNVKRVRRGLLLGLLAVSTALAACTVVESYRIPVTAVDPQIGTPCASRLGSYSLPRAHLKIKVGKTKEGKSAIEKQGTDVVKVIRHPDSALTFCLDHVNSYTSDDVIKILKSPLLTGNATENQAFERDKGALLGAVTVNATDQSVYIINSLIRALFIFLSGDPDFGAGRTVVETLDQTLADLEFDPFNPIDSSSANRRLSKLGYCLVLEGFTFDTSRASVDQYCNDPERYAGVVTIVTKAYVRLAAEPANPILPGIHYRPRYPYRLMIFQRSDKRGRWELSRMETVELENASPVMTLGIGRAAFGRRSAYFLFHEGTLVTACLSKTSEIAGFVEIPLEISRSLVELPGAIFKVQINQFDGLNELAQVQQQLYQAQKAQMQAAAGAAYVPPKDAAGKDFQGKAYQDALKATQGYKMSNGLASLLLTSTDAVAYPDVLGRPLSKLCAGNGTG